MWSHVYWQEYHVNVNTDNFTESFNNVFKNQYLTLRHDKSIFFTKILLHCVFPDQEREHTVLTARQSSHYRVPQTAIPDFLADRPLKVQNSCLANIYLLLYQNCVQKIEYIKLSLQVVNLNMMLTLLMASVHILISAKRKFHVNIFLVFLITMVGHG